MFIIIVGRFFGVLGLVYLLVLFKHKKKVTLKELIFICYAGMIRGAIAFGLVLKIDDSVKEKDVIITTSLTLVVVTTLLYGGTMPLVQRILVPPKEADKHEYDDHEIIVIPEGDGENRHLSEHEEFLHPNLISEKDDEPRKS
jgi:NhaP-type Na+/H+ or K+/H+ antiporter